MDLQSSANTRVVPATDGDLPCLCELLGVLFSQEEEFQPDSEVQASGLREILANPEVGRVLVLKQDTMAIGMVSLLFLPSTALGGRVAILEDLIVRPDKRGAGSGGLLIAAAIDCASECGCRRITLLTDGSNEAARRFYRRHGFASSRMVPMRLMMTAIPSS